MRTRSRMPHGPDWLVALPHVMLDVVTLRGDLVPGLGKEYR